MRKEVRNSLSLLVGWCVSEKCGNVCIVLMFLCAHVYLCLGFMRTCVFASHAHILVYHMYIICVHKFYFLFQDSRL